jgi:hypothetical protein
MIGGCWYACDMTQRRDTTHSRGLVVVVLPRIPA